MTERPRCGAKEHLTLRRLHWRQAFPGLGVQGVSLWAHVAQGPSATASVSSANTSSSSSAIADGALEGARLLPRVVAFFAIGFVGGGGESSTSICVSWSSSLATAFCLPLPLRSAGLLLAGIGFVATIGTSSKEMSSPLDGLL